MSGKAQGFAALSARYGVKGLFLGHRAGRLIFRFVDPADPTRFVEIDLSGRDLNMPYGMLDTIFIQPMLDQFGLSTLVLATPPPNGNGA